jgi:hypothetical protein
LELVLDPFLDTWLGLVLGGQLGCGCKAQGRPRLSPSITIIVAALEEPVKVPNQVGRYFLSRRYRIIG